MADPLSITAGVVGLLATSTKIIKTLSDVCSSVSDAPESARSVLVAVETTKLSLSSIKDLFDTIATLPPERKALIRLDHIAVTCSQCVLTLSELEELVCRQFLKNGGSLFDRLRWSWGEKRVLSLLPRLESQKNCIALMISVLQCQSWADALKDSSKLNEAVDNMLLGDENLAARIEQSGREIEPETQSIASADSQSTARPQEADTGASQSGQVDEHELQDSQVSSQLQDYERLLEASRVYTRANPNEIDLLSVRGSTIRTMSSTLSDISLNHMSIIAVYRLPITLNDINSIGTGLTFATHIAQTQRAPRERLGHPVLKMLTTSQQNVKVVIVGDSLSCKTKLILRFTTPKLPDEPIVPTVFDNYTAVVKFRNLEHHIAIWDSSGSDDYDRLRPLSYPQTDVFIICARIPRPTMFSNVQDKWIPDIKEHNPNSPFLIVGIIDEEDNASLAASLEEQSQKHRNAPKSVSDYYALGRKLVESHEKAWKYMQCNLASDEEVRRVFQQALLAHMNQRLDGQNEKPPRRIRAFGRRRQKFDPINLEDIDEDDWSYTSGDKRT
ncbi:P-loop containing nucleoside triphosphate hydrolase protein [Podospora aff. communis PSN243]|uniref:P-loop containing nucleoside triphosphate hydrolase protein n=1 Tax=Podospora aff. communis PSN243 TaxID=3040156 RepID=A0AAV9GF10_9PEZI|nr:P-loop containing nucleoside triphosphate hydrolase protein [Podospora aff. communis PSN243]